MSPTRPLGAIVPVAAILWPPVSSPGVSLSSSASVNASPADGPLTWPESMPMSIGNEKVRSAGGASFGMKPMIVRLDHGSLGCGSSTCSSTGLVSFTRLTVTGTTSPALRPTSSGGMSADTCTG